MLKFGWHPSPDDVRIPKLRLRGSLLSSPSSQHWGRPEWVGYWGMMLNDALGDCVIASKGHFIILYTTLTGTHKNIILPDSAILKGYEDVGGYVLGDPSTDNGCFTSVAAEYWKTTGYGGHKISSYAQLPKGDVPSIQASINLFGGVDYGFAVPDYAMTQFYRGEPWDLVSESPIRFAGGHLVPIVGYDRVLKMYEVVTWGKIQYMTERFMLQWGGEYWTYLSPDWIFNNMAPNKYLLWQLNQDLQDLLA